MAHTDRATRRALSREIAGTIGLLTDEHDFRAMRRYRSFAFDDHTAYLLQVEALLKTRASQGTHTAVALFDPEEYAEFCTAAGLDPDAPASRGRFTAELAANGPTVPYDGRPLTELLPVLVDEAVRQATWEYTATLLARLGTCATCGEDLGRAAFTRASHLLRRVLETAPPGNRHLVCSVSGAPETLVAVLHADDEIDGTHTSTRPRHWSSPASSPSAWPPTAPADSSCASPPRADPTASTAGACAGTASNPSPPARSSTPTAPTSNPATSSHPESNVDYCAPPDLGDDHRSPGHHH